ncbi:hypothetical protein KEM55_003178, partial [Ascosphaera atra]
MRGTGAQEELKDLNELGQMHNEVNKAEAIEVTRIQAEVETKRFGKMTGLVNKLVDAQVASMHMQHEQQGKFIELLNK